MRLHLPWHGLVFQGTCLLKLCNFTIKWMQESMNLLRRIVFGTVSQWKHSSNCSRSCDLHKSYKIAPCRSKSILFFSLHIQPLEHISKRERERRCEHLKKECETMSKFFCCFFMFQGKVLVIVLRFQKSISNELKQHLV